MTAATSTGEASAAPSGGAYVSPQFSPKRVKIDHSDLRPATAGPPTTVPEGEPFPPLPPGKRRPIIDPAIQLRVKDQQGTGADTRSLQDLAGDLSDAGIGLITNPILNFGGINSNAEPPDTVMDVGPNHVVQMTNGTTFQIWNKTGTSLAGPSSFGALWPAGDPCNSNLGDPIVVYDHLANRWVLSQFARNAAQTQFWMCVAVSQTASPLPAAGLFLYTLEVPVFPDYPKFGVWPDGYYMSSYEGGNLGIFAFDRARMLNGEAAGFVKFTIATLNGPNRDTRILPADLDGPPPPDGTPNYFFRSVDDLQDNADANDRLEVFEFHVDWLQPANSTFTLVTRIDGTSAVPIAPFNTMACNRNGQGVRDCIPQPGSDDTLDALSNRPMMQLKFRVLGANDFRMVVNQAIDASGTIPATLGITVTQEVAGIRWYELARGGGPAWAIRQQSTFAAQPLDADAESDLLHRWMGSMAIDRFGNIAVGYSIVNSDTTTSVFPGIRYTGRRFDDPLGSMQQGERTLFTGTVAQGNSDGTTNPARWGDYSTLTVDPIDDCTFWFTTHVARGEPGSRTRIGSFRFDNCGTDLSITKTASPTQVVAGSDLTYTISVKNNGPIDATNVTVTDTLPAGVTYVASTVPCTGVGTLTCTLGTIASGATKSFDLKVKVSAGAVASGTTSLTNTATVSADQPELNPADNQASVATLVSESADLRIAKTCKPDGVAVAGTNATCEIIVDNLGASTARNVIVVDRLVSNGPFTASAVASAGACGPLTGGSITCTLGDLAAGGRVTITVTESAAGTIDINDIATVTSDTPDPNTANNTATGAVSFVALANLSLTKTSAPNPVVAGTNLTYTINVANTGPSTASAVVVRDTLPASVAVVSATPTLGSCTGGIPGNPAQPLICSLGDLPSGAAQSIVLIVKVDPATPEGTILINNASVGSATADPDIGNNSQTATTTVQARADLQIVKTSDQPSYKPNSTISFIVTVTNNGASNARGVVVTDNMPISGTQVQYLSNTGGCTQAGAVLTCNLGDMAIGTNKSFNVYMLVKGNRGNITNNASVTSLTTDPSPGNNTASRTVSVK